MRRIGLLPAAEAIITFPVRNTMTRKASRSEQVISRERSISDDTILKMTKEIAVKFIEVGRCTPATFKETFKDIHQTIEETVRNKE